MNRHITSSEDFERLNLRGAILAQVRISAAHVDLIFALAMGDNAEIRIESGATVTMEGGESIAEEAGPRLGVEVLQLLDAEISRVESDDLDLVLVFEGHRVLALNVDSSGYESYSVTVAGETWVALRGVEE